MRRQFLWIFLILSLVFALLMSYAYESGKQAAALHTRTDTLRMTVARLDTVYRTDTVRLWSMVRQVDTLVMVDSIPIIAADSARADSSLRLLRSTLEVCVETVMTCEQRVAAEHRLRVLADSEVVRQSRQAIPQQLRALSIGAMAGAIIALILAK